MAPSPSDYELVAGLDEVGWGAGAGPIVSVMVVMRTSELKSLPKGIGDSKKLSSIKRKSILKQLCDTVAEFGVGVAEPQEIDKMSPKWALQETYTRALNELKLKPEVLFVDGNEWMNKVQAFKGPQFVIPKADSTIVQVSIASIIAKEIRDSIMEDRAVIMKKAGLSDYNWASNKGYLTADHTAEIKKHGLLLGPTHYEHRRSYCSKFLGHINKNA
jgi:ribonuclease HII